MKKRDICYLQKKFGQVIYPGSGMLLIFLVLLSLLSCCKHSVSSGSQLPGTGQNHPSPKQNHITFVSPNNHQRVFYGSSLGYEISFGDSVNTPDSVRIKIDNLTVAKQPVTKRTGSIKVTDLRMGNHALRAELYVNGKQRGSGTVTIEVLPEKEPVAYTYQKIKVYPHDPASYTQGLVYEDGMMYESTGLRGESTLRKWVPETGKLVASLTLPPDLFGEGCTLLGNDIYQLTWTSRVGFVYDKESFAVKKRLKYSTQGWGLTTDGDRLIMSDGSHYLYFLDPEYFSVLDRIEVYDHNGPVDQLNELELINGMVWANVYMTDDIVIIDPGNGRVTGRIHLKGLLPNKEYGPDTDVLNGIAWDSEHNRIFLTGKKWPKMFEIRPVPLPPQDSE